ncbi:unnamed protein product [Porites lobata]|uniref:PPPDE domain-containing protein n=1 Tax=Porites lobata TaxID=104759 RepID=A0ABN8MYM3_9CNID|nr:unnamed protein product [Porites lobata]
MEKIPVKLYVYDISRGFAKQLSPLLLGKRIEGVWHTGIVCFGREYFYGGGGIESCLPGGTILGSPDEVVDLGDTEIFQDVFEEFLNGIGQQDFRPEKYHLFEHNCNTFSAEVAMFLTGNKIPQHIQDLPSEVLNTSFGQMIRPIIDSMSVRPTAASGTSSVSHSSSASSSSTTGPESIFEPRDTSSANQTATGRRGQPDGCQSSVLRKANTYNQVDTASDVAQLKDILTDTKEFSDEELSHLDELKDCLHNKNLIGVQERQIQILDKVVDKYLTQEKYCSAVQLSVKFLQVLSLNDQLFSDSKGLQETVNMTCRQFSDINSSSSQVECVKLYCCVTSHQTGHSVMFKDTRFTPLAAVTVNCLLSKNEDLTTVGAALASNIARFKVHEEIALECSTAVIEVLSKDLSPETGHNCLYALRRFIDCSSEVAGLASVLGLSVEKFKGSSPEMDDLCKDLEKLLS